MLFSESWLREWVNPDISSDELMARITMAGLEVDGSEPAAPDFSGVVVAQVQSVAAHPDADKLRVCQVFDGTETVQVVCGASNVCEGMKVPFARVGAVLPENFRIKKAKLRGVESSGMLCAAEELGLDDGVDGLLVLPESAPVGEDVRRYLALDDTLIDVDLTPNRGDCLSIAGLAREVAVLTAAPSSPVEVSAVPATIEDHLPVTLDAPEDCPRYLGRLIRRINPQVPSPFWLKEKLRRSGIRSIDPVVDVTNYVLIELGHPMHAFDASRLSGGIHVRRAHQGETLVLLDGREVTLDEETLVIADEEKALAMAGVMGGEFSAVSEQTRDIFLESAFFQPLSIAGRARRYGLQTDAAHRYERGVDYALAARAMERATALLLSIVGGEAGPIVQAAERLPQAPEVSLRRGRIQELLGLSLTDERVVDILTGLGLELISSSDTGWAFRVPSWRFDIALEVDLIEELARIHGYNNLPVSAPGFTLHLKPQTETALSLRQFRRVLVNAGYQDVVTYSFVEPGLEARLSGEENEPVTLANPISQDMSVMRSSLWPGLLKTLKHNQNRQQQRLRLFESGLVFLREGGEIVQPQRLGGLLWGSESPEQWGQRARAVDFFDLKGDVESLLAQGHALESYRFVADKHPALQPGQSARICRDDKSCGWLGALHPAIQQHLDIPGKVFLFELDVQAVRESRLPVAQELSRYPSVRRDLAMIVDEKLEIASLLDTLRASAGDTLVDLSLFDLYVGENIGKNKKSLALGLTFQHAARTLQDEEINSIIENCIKVLESKFNIELRK